jgi:hypothetical protein
MYLLLSINATVKKASATYLSLSYHTMAMMALRPPSEIVPKHNEDSGGRGKKNIGE